MTKHFGVVYEGEADFRTATDLADRALVEAIDWLEQDQLAPQRSWERVDSKGQSLSWKAIKRLAREAGVQPHYGHFQGEPARPDAAAARRAIDYLRFTFPQLDAILLIRDQDDQPERRAGLEQARQDEASGMVVVIGLAIVERECWVISGFDAQDEGEESRISAERSMLGFDPRLRSHELTACKNDNSIRSPKRVLRQLSSGDLNRELRCWTEAPLESLRVRGSENGLAEFLREVRERLAPLLGHVMQH